MQACRASWHSPSEERQGFAAHDLCNLKTVGCEDGLRRQGRSQFILSFGQMNDVIVFA